MKIFLLSCFCACLFGQAYGQALVWEKKLNSTANNLVTDPNGNIILLGGNGTATQLDKYTKDGLLLWSNLLTKSTSFTTSGSVVSDKSGNIYIYSEGFDSLNHVFTGVRTRGITKFNPQGNILWHTKFYASGPLNSTPEPETKLPIQLDEQGNVYAGYFTSGSSSDIYTIRLGNLDTAVSANNYYMAIGSLAPDGTPRWVRGFKFVINQFGLAGTSGFSIAGNRLFITGYMGKYAIVMDNGMSFSTNRCTAWMAAFSTDNGQTLWRISHSLFIYCTGSLCACSTPSLNANPVSGKVTLTNSLNGAFVFKPLDTIASIKLFGETATKSYYTIYDTLGNPIKGKIIETADMYNDNETLHGSRGNALFVQFRDTLRKVDTGFNLLWKVTLPAIEKVHVPANGNDLYAIYTRSGTRYLAKMADSAGIISGKVYADWDNNGIYNSADSLLSNILITTNGAPNAASGTDSGKYYLYAAPGTYNLTAHFNHPYYEFLPAVQTATVAQLSQTVAGKDFRLRPTFNFTDVSVNFSSLNIARPGRTAYYAVTVKNFGAATLPVEVSLKLPALTSYNSIAGGTVTVHAIDSITIAAGMINPFETKQVLLYLDVATTATLQDTLKFYPVAYPFVTDTVKTNNRDTLLQMVRTSFDPNEKEVSKNGQPIAEAGKSLLYTVRFQNTGNDTAFYVRIADTLSAKLDLKTFSFVDASHPVVTDIRGNVVNFIFNPIELPDSNINEPLSHGFVKFKINPAQPASVNDTIYNAAAIYFDYNTPVATNSVKSWFNPLPVLPVILKSFVAEKKATAVLLKFVTASEADFTHFVIERSFDGTSFSPVGTVAATGTPSSGAAYFFEDKSPARGTNFYRLKMVDRNTRPAYSWILVVNFREDPRPAITVFPNPAHDNLYISFREFNGPKTFTCTIADAGGKVVWTASINTGTRDTYNVNTSRLANGIYFIKVAGRDMNYQRKFTVQH